MENIKHSKIKYCRKNTKLTFLYFRQNLRGCPLSMSIKHEVSNKIAQNRQIVDDGTNVEFLVNRRETQNVRNF